MEDTEKLSIKETSETQKTFDNYESKHANLFDPLASFAIRDQEMTPNEFDDLRNAYEDYDRARKETVDLLQQAKEDKETKEKEKFENERLSAKRLWLLASKEHQSAGMSLHYDYDENKKTETNYYLIGNTSVVAREATKVLGAVNVKAYEVVRQYDENHALEQNKSSVSIYYEESNELRKRKISLPDSFNEEGFSVDTAFVVSVEGDIAGHAKRALPVAESLVDLGYDQNTYWVASGRYSKITKAYEEKIKHVQLHDSKPGVESEMIITALEGTGGVLIWDKDKVEERAGQYEEAFKLILNEIGDQQATLISDFAPIGDIVWKALAVELGRADDVVMSETHNVEMPRDRMIRVFKAYGIPIGEIAYQLTNSRLMKKLDPDKKVYQIVNGFFNNTLDRHLGNPLFRFRVKKQVEPERGKSFRDEMLSFDGHTTFGLGQITDTNVGLLAEEATLTASVHEQVQAINTRSGDRPTIYHNEGSTYDPDAFIAVHETLNTFLPTELYTVHATGNAESQKMTDSGVLVGTQEANNEVLGYAPGYNIILSCDMEIAINQGGWGTFSQSISATIHKLTSLETQLLFELGKENFNLDDANKLIKSRGGPLRWVSIPRTWEQESNARWIEEEGGFCEIITPAELKSQKGKDRLKVTVQRALDEPLSEKEMKFWTDLHTNVTQSEPALHSAMILERRALERKKAASQKLFGNSST